MNKKINTDAISLHLREIREMQENPMARLEFVQQMEVVSFALNWRVYKTVNNLYLVGTDKSISQAFLEQDDAIRYMTQQIYA